MFALAHRRCKLLTRSVGITSFLVLRMWFGKAVEDFNRDISKEGADAPQLIAATSNGFISMYCCRSDLGLD